jgi:hypothetical protein
MVSITQDVPEMFLEIDDIVSDIFDARAQGDAPDAALIVPEVKRR